MHTLLSLTTQMLFLLCLKSFIEEESTDMLVIPFQHLSNLTGRKFYVMFTLKLPCYPEYLF